MVLLSTHNISFGWEIRKLFFFYTFLTKVQSDQIFISYMHQNNKTEASFLPPNLINRDLLGCKSVVKVNKSWARSANDLFTYDWRANSDILNNNSLPGRIYFDSNTQNDKKVVA